MALVSPANCSRLGFFSASGFYLISFLPYLHVHFIVVVEVYACT